MSSELQETVWPCGVGEALAAESVTRLPAAREIPATHSRTVTRRVLIGLPPALTSGSSLKTLGPRSLSVKRASRRCGGVTNESGRDDARLFACSLRRLRELRAQEFQELPR